MIYTITLNPSIDHIIETSGFNLNETNYYQNDYQVVGGKGINVAVLLNNLGSSVLATGFLGETNKKVFLDQFQAINLENNFQLFSGPTRTNFKIKDLKIKAETELNGEGVIVASNIVQSLLKFLDQHLEPNDLVIASGSVPKCVDVDIYYQIGQIVNQHEGCFLLDSSKQWIKEGLKAKPYLIKPNLEEICQMLNQPYNSTASLTEIKAMIDELRVLGARNILVSMGSKGSLYFSEDNHLYETGVAKGQLVNSVGAGDSMVGGFAYGLANHLSIEETLQYGAASGAATAFTQ